MAELALIFATITPCPLTWAHCGLASGRNSGSVRAARVTALVSGGTSGIDRAVAIGNAVARWRSSNLTRRLLLQEDFTVASMLQLPVEPEARASSMRAGFRFGARGTHSSRTIMLAELRELLAAVADCRGRADYAAAIIQENVLGKETAVTRRMTNQRLGELYALDPQVPIFRVLRRLWVLDESGRPLLALLCACARDPLLRASAQVVLALTDGAELVRGNLLDAIRQSVDPRLSDAVLGAVVRNVASSWTQSGHLIGRIRKIRRRVSPTPGTTALALWLGTAEGLAGRSLLDSFWTRVLDRSPEELLRLALEAKQLGFIQARAAGNVVEIDARGLDPALAA